MGYKRKRERAICAICGNSLLLAANGDFRLHRIVWKAPNGSDSPIIRSSGPCPGSFHAPGWRDPADPQEKYPK